MHVAFLTPIAALGGAERSLLDMLDELRRLCPDWTIGVIVGEDGPLVSQLQQRQVRTCILPLPQAIRHLGESYRLWSPTLSSRRYPRFGPRWWEAAWSLPSYVCRLRRLLLRWRPAIVHSHALKFHLLSGWVAPAGARIVWHLRDFLSPRPYLSRWLPRIARRPHLMFANSQAVAEDAQRLFPRTAIHTLYNGIDTGYFSPHGPTFNWDNVVRARAGADHCPPVRIGLVATYARWKGHELFLQAATQLLRESLPPVQFYIVGGPIYHTFGSQFSPEELQLLIGQLGLNGYCHLIPFQQDIAAVYRGLDIVVHASTRPEPFGRTIVEAMACGRTVIVSAAGGADELCTDGVDALKFPPGDLSRLVQALRRAILDPHLRNHMGQNARATACARFDRHRMGQNLLACYQLLLRPDLRRGPSSLLSTIESPRHLSYTSIPSNPA